MLWDYYRRLELPGGADRSGKMPFQIQLEKMLWSENELERWHVPYGESWYTGLPVLVHRSQVHEHGAFLGAPASGKTSLGITRLGLYAIWASSTSRTRWLAERGFRPEPRYSLVVIDFKGANTNLGLLNTLW